ncbi:MAG: response regulator [Thermodesulforhabdaceae bacterium]
MITVLLVERDHDFRKGIVRQLMTMSGFGVLEVSNETELNEALLTRSVDVALVGVSAGTRYQDIEIVEKINRTKPEIPVIVMVPEKLTSLSIEAMRFGARDDIFVPFDVVELVEKIYKVLGIKRRKKAGWKEKLERALVGITFAEANLDKYARGVLSEGESSSKNGESEDLDS